jgi:hypothetical protein
MYQRQGASRRRRGRRNRPGLAKTALAVKVDGERRDVAL